MTTGTTPTEPLTEAHITRLVRRFYDLALQDDLLGPLFRIEIPDLEAHIPVVENFWSQALLGTNRYTASSPYAKHTHLKVQPEHFDRWMACFTQAVAECLPPADGARAMARANQMTASFKSGMLPLPEPRPRAPKTPPQ